MTLLSAIKSPATVNLVTIFSTRGSGSSLYSYITLHYIILQLHYITLHRIPELTQGDLEQIYDHEFYPLHHLETQMFFFNALQTENGGGGKICCNRFASVVGQI